MNSTPPAALLAIGSSSTTYRLSNTVIKVPRIDSDPEITAQNAKAATTEANVYKILGAHDRIAKCLYISPTTHMIQLEYYPNGTVRDYVAARRGDVSAAQLVMWAKQMIEGVEFIHAKGVRHADVRLDQWLLDQELGARLSDFNSAGYDACPSLGLAYEPALGLESASYFLPRDVSEDSSDRSDLFALGWALYELECGRAPYADKADDLIAELFRCQNFPPVEELVLGSVITACWHGDSIPKMDLIGVAADEQGSQEDNGPALVGTTAIM